MFGRLQSAANDSISASSSNGRTGSGGGGGVGGSTRNIAGSALRRAGLIDDDVGMRSASASGPSRARGGKRPTRGAGGASSGSAASAGPSRIQIDDEGAGKTGKARKARDRANPLAGRLSRSTRPPTITGDSSVSGQVFAIRGAASAGGGAAGAAKGKGRGRVPGGGGVNGDHAPSSSFNTQGTIGVLRRFLASRWNGSANFLNLDNMQADEILKESKVIPPGTPGAHKDIGAVMWKLASELYPGLTTLSLGNNDLKTLAPLSQLPQHLPNIQNLSLEGNDLKWTKDLSTFAKNKNGSLKNLRELMLTGNPMQQNAVSAMNEEGYRAEVLSHFPTLTLLDRVPVTPKESAIAQLPSSSKSSAGGKRGKGSSTDVSATLGPDTPTKPFELPIKPGFSDEAADGIVPGFLAKFFQLYDSARDSSELRAAYASNATFSCSLNQRVPPRAVAAGFLTSPDMPRQKDLNWHGYTGKGLNNHDIMGLGIKSAAKGFPVGANSIMAVLAKMPKTTHPLNDASKFVVDSWLLPNGAVGALVGAESSSSGDQQRPDAVLFINVKGEFQEAPSMGHRSFDRTFIVAPSAPGSAAQQAGWPCVILSEQLTVRHYSGVQAWRPGPLASGSAPQAGSSNGQQAPPQQQPQQPGAPAAPGPAPPAGIDESQHLLSLEFARQTGLTYPFALQCLQENGWQPQTAMTVFQNLKAQGAIPAEAFGPVA